MKGCIEEVRTDLVKGWAFDSLRPADSPRIRVLLGDAVIAEDVATTVRPDVAKAMGVDNATCGFRMAVTLAAGDPQRVTVQARTDGKWVDLARIRPRSARVSQTRSYQDFDGSGASKSQEKLKALHLDSLTVGRRGAGEPPLKGKSVLDIGCNEGFFCAEALRQGASRVLGVDANKTWIDKARDRVKGAEFLQASWWDIPNEKFDVIFFLSAIHYEPEPKKLLDKIATHLTDDGALVLECGVKVGSGKKQWHVVPRWDGAKRYPSLTLLRQELLSSYGVRSIGQSVTQAGDPVPRYVFHCRPRRPVAMLITGASHAGKTALAYEMVDRGIPYYDSDSALGRLLTGKELAGIPLAKKLKEKFGADSLKHLGLVSKHLVSAGLSGEFVEFVIKELPREADLFVIEGEAFRHKEVQTVLFKQLSNVGVRAWLVERGN